MSPEGAREDEGAPDPGQGRRLRGPWWGPRRHLTEEQRGHVLSQLYYEGVERLPFLRRFSALLTFSVLIAVLGLARDSGPVVIGAMLVSPLTTPLLGLSTALVMAWPRRQLESFAILVLASIAGIVVAWVTLWLIPEPKFVTLASQELLARTEPRLLDLGIAIIAGAAGAYVLVRREAIGALPGVAIAVALVPPLSTVGMMLELGEGLLALDALLLYLTNLAGIVMAASLVMVLTGMHPHTSHGQRLPRRAWIGILAASLAVLVVSVPLVVHTNDQLNKAIEHDDATTAITEWAAGTGLEIADIRVEEDSVHADVVGPESPPPLDPLAEQLADDFGHEVTLEVGWTKQRLLRSAAGE